MNNDNITKTITNNGMITVIKIFIIKCFSKKSYKRNLIKKHTKKITIDTDTTSKIFCNIDPTI